jgi:hypothetical protein
MEFFDIVGIGFGPSNNCRVDPCNPTAYQRHAHCVHGYVVTSPEQIQFIEPRPK